jgi:Uma2 family endonuclease
VRLSLEDYHRLIDLGFFDEDDRVEFLEGHIVARSPQGPLHSKIARLIAKTIQLAVGERLSVQTHSPLTLARSEPEPDVAVIDETRHRGPRHPTSALLVVEVSGRDSLRKDRSVKAALYAEAAVEEYWVVDLEAEVVRVHRDVDPVATEYRTQLVVGKEGLLRPVALPGVELAVARLFAA